MGKAIAYLVIVFVGAMLLQASGIFDGMFSSNLEKRSEYWRETVAREAPQGASRTVVDALMARHGMSLECFYTSVRPPVMKCHADDITAKGGMGKHPLTLSLTFTFNSDQLQMFGSSPRVLR